MITIALCIEVVLAGVAGGIIFAHEARKARATAAFERRGGRGDRSSGGRDPWNS